MLRMTVFSFSTPKLFFFPPIAVNAWLTNPCLVIVFRAEFLSDASRPQCSMYLVYRSRSLYGLFMQFPVDKESGF